MAACVVLCFGFVTKAVLITCQRFGYCWTVLTKSQGFHCFSLCTSRPPRPSPVSRLRVGKKLGRRHSRDTWPRVTKRLSCTTMLSEDWEGSVVFQVSYCSETELERGGEWLPLHHFGFFSALSLIKLSLSWAMRFLSFLTSAFSLPHPARRRGVSEWLGA